MNDDTQNPPADPQSQQNPLDALEELLAKTQAASSGGGVGAVGAGGTNEDPAAAAAATEAADAAIKAQAEAERLLAEAAQAEKDNLQIEEQRHALENVKDTPEYQARVQQIQEDTDAKAEESNLQAGYDIAQLDHKKI